MGWSTDPGGSQAVVLLNRGDSDNEQITVRWSDIGFPVDHRGNYSRSYGLDQDLGSHSLAITHHQILPRTQ